MLKAVAAKEHRTLSSLVRIYCAEGLERDGLSSQALTVKGYWLEGNVRKEKNDREIMERPRGILAFAHSEVFESMLAGSSEEQEWAEVLGPARSHCLR